MPSQTAQLLTILIALAIGFLCYKVLQKHERKPFLTSLQFRFISVAGFLSFLLGAFIALRNLIF
jgi:type IV secretory pathway TrbL component